ncbi:hypothetical protein DFJ58DRAFT_734143 [Suillus subalutaceus]|uniref:uncharacterized protein n=1 Tax=Suillus subalutaceus TaxID=48586 RepID=UPI001B87AA66|nr:uncharacterized protein DFJ58DRAFT_734143 [Suillus subalutaceus]KAG1837854.1 hypothetical protein DFJ58DRAFT_734143 [Suillus subalutaceus]
MAALDVDSDEESVDVPAHGAPNTVAAAEPASESIPHPIESILRMSSLSNIDKNGTDIAVPNKEADPVVQELQDTGGEAKFQDVLSVPAQFSIAPSGSLSVAALLLINLPTVLENSASAARIVFSKQSPLLQLPTDFVSQPVPPFQTASSLRNCARGAF